MKGSRILVIEDDASIRELVRQLLERAGLEPIEAADGKAGLLALYSERPDLVLLDVTLPELDGWQTLERVRELTDVPVMMVTGHASELEKVRALQAGADDYVTKPFGVQELLARIQALLRRAPTRKEIRERYDDGIVAADFAGREATVKGTPLSLTPLEFRLLSALIQHPNQILSPEQLLELAWGGAERASRDQVKLYVGYLRKKMAEHGAVDAAIENVRGFGYRYSPPGTS
jgi:DNA-binding response OmpR family regulator